ncbi:MAG TPA: hypothetical protein PLO33_12285 [Kouleothrix sp.]|uniref:hypothetical protein n=1 Tax=Kouleothrix sp. TaxID=2779161 RepID=UPI002B72D15B|nr:hypothetical protein [Kouleothrix sp.]HRC76445.1 hypothetical protein [Kouleothrix sp.]
MNPNYSEQDTERARQAERSSAGLQTQQLSAASYTTPARPLANNRNNTLALGLIAVGMLLFLGRLGPLHVEYEGGMVLLTIASCFLFFSFWKRIYGLLIPGGILAGLSMGVAFADMTNGVSVLWGLALGFMAVLFGGRILFNKQSAWPAIPAVVLFAIGTIVAVASLPGLFAGGLVWLPLLLIGAGLYLGWGRSRLA